jgi:Ankyrin repeats (3 copies)
MDLFHWAVQYGFIWDIEDNEARQEAGHLACENGQLEALKWLHENGADLLGENMIGEETGCCISAAIGRHLPVLEFLDSICAGWDEHTIHGAICYGHLHIVKYLLDNEFPTDDESCAIAAFFGHLDILQFLRSQDFKWDDQVTAHAAAAGQMEIIV